jgi:nucleoside-diphosphate-sugar epimerase
MSHYLVTGGAGFIGSHLAEELVRRGARVRVADNLSTGKLDNLEHLREVEFLQGDLADLDVAREAVKGVDYVLHQAAIPSVPRSVSDPVTSNRSNVDATLNVLVAARDAGVRRVVYAGSSSAYGNAPALPKHEEMPAAPLSPYALQKLVGEQYMAMFTRLYGLETVTTRYFNVFGPRQDPSSPYSGVISLFISALVDGRRPIIYGDGEQTRDFTYVANVVDGVLRACHAPGIGGEMINVATGGRVSLNHLLATLGDLVGRRGEAIYQDDRAGDVRDSQADIAKAQRLTGYAPTVSFEDGLARTLAWYREEQGNHGSLVSPVFPPHR